MVAARACTDAKPKDELKESPGRARTGAKKKHQAQRLLPGALLR